MKIKLANLLVVLFSLTVQPAHAHTGIAAVHGLLDGLAHPLLGVDHFLVMLAVGLWAALRGGRSLWLLPAAFLTAMAAGAVLALQGAAVTAAETGVAGSLVAAGLLVWRNPRLSSAAAAALVAAFALVHGYVHAAELATGGDALSYALGFLLTTAALHGVGLTIGLLAAARLKLLSAGFGLLCAGVGLSLLTGI